MSTLTSPRLMLTLLLLPTLVVRLLLFVRLVVLLRLAVFPERLAVFPERLAELPPALARLPPPPPRLLLETELWAWRPPWLPPPPPPPPRPPPPRCAIASLAHRANTQELTSRPARKGVASSLRIGFFMLAITCLLPGTLRAVRTGRGWHPSEPRR